MIPDLMIRAMAESKLAIHFVIMPLEERDLSRSAVILLDRLRVGGTEKQGVWLDAALRQCGWQCHLRLLFPEDTECERSSSVPVADGGLAVLRSFLGVLQELRDSRPDVLICMGRTANSLGFLAKLLFPGLKLVTTCRTNRALPLLYRFSLRRSERCIANSQWAADQVGLVIAGAPERVVHIENALLRPHLFDLDRSPAAKAAARIGLGLAADTPVLCNISSFVPGKNKGDLLSAFARSRIDPTAVLLLVGEGSERAKCEQYAQELGIGDRVRFFGKADAIEPFLQVSDLFVSTSLRDSLPNALVEAQAAGLPVVAYDVAGAAEAFESERSGLAVTSGEVDAFARAIERLMSSPKLRHDFGAYARTRASALYAPEVIAARYDTVLRGLFDV